MRIAASLIVAAVMLSLAAGCRRDEVTHFRVAKEQPAPSLARPAGMGGSSEQVPPPAAPTGPGALKWTLPKGWTESVAGGIRYATLKPSVPGHVDVSVVVLPGDAGGELANVNRWRGQIGLSAIDEPALASARKAIRSKAGPVSVYDFSSEGEKKTRLVAGLAVAEGNSWFIKMVGDAEPVATAKPEFIRLLESLRLEEAH